MFVCQLSDASARAASGNSARSKPACSAWTPGPYVNFHEGELETLRGAGRGEIYRPKLVFDGAD
jgi:hypothetical protein